MVNGVASLENQISNFSLHLQKVEPFFKLTSSSLKEMKLISGTNFGLASSSGSSRHLTHTGIGKLIITTAIAMSYYECPSVEGST